MKSPAVTSHGQPYRLRVLKTFVEPLRLETGPRGWFNPHTILEESKTTIVENLNDSNRRKIRNSGLPDRGDPKR